ncbi:PNO1 [Symbiodinium sp. KB8]|nr:PNO1 [Symbiodinium sp. KB8]
MRPLVEHMRLQVRFNPKTRCVEMRNGKSTEDSGALTKAEEFVSAFMCGFEVRDAIALLRLEDLRVGWPRRTRAPPCHSSPASRCRTLSAPLAESFDVTDVKTLRGDHLSRAIGRIAGMGGKTKFAIENATRTRIVVADAKVHILGAYANIQVARDAVCSLILGSPPGKIYNQMRNVAARIGQRY